MGKAAGVDEAGRGPWAGPVVASCVILNDRVKNIEFSDSKILSEKKREYLYNIITSSCVYGIGASTNNEIDKLGIVKATELAIIRAIDVMTEKPTFLLIDGKDRFNLPFKYKSIEHGDRKIKAISAASIVAKVWRDRYMKLMGDMYSVYGFEKHKGYGTQLHIDNLNMYGISNIHRKSFKPIMKIIELNNKKPTLLLHACCAPCATTVIERLKDKFDITIFFYNPNIHPIKEYHLRLKEIEKLTTYYNIKLIKGIYDINNWFSKTKHLKNSKEGSTRCSICYANRLLKTAQTAKDLGFNYFSTTLSTSPLKSFKKIENISLKIASMYNISFLDEDFKKKNGFKESCELSHKFKFYRQNYCGCIYSRRSNG